ncbi:MAG: glutaredoxin family protein [Gammaproteobacteria bacterium]|nr:glutaredoxin family protein [Gammaproteobacteria bacterium]MCP5136258.1 glutaredoxin family protein [Gammaproteobacteria bacterium]
MKTWKVLMLMLMLLCPPAHSEVFKWVDDAGNVYYGDHPPSEAQIQTLSEAAIVSALPMRAPAVSAGPKVVVYSTTHCGYCKRAKAHLERRGIAFDERDVERSGEYRSEFRKLGGKGVPLIVVGDQLLKGYRAESLDAMLAKAGL